MAEFPRTFEVIVTPNNGQNVAELIAQARRETSATLQYKMDNGDGTHTVSFVIHSFAAHPTNMNAVRGLGFAGFVAHELEHQTT